MMFTFKKWNYCLKKVMAWLASLSDSNAEMNRKRTRIVIGILVTFVGLPLAFVVTAMVWFSYGSSLRL